MEDIIKDYLYTGVPFFTYYIDDVVKLCLKVELSKGLNKLINLSKLKVLINNHPDYDKCLKGNEHYLVYQNVVALEDSSFLITDDYSSVNLYKKIKRTNDPFVVQQFNIDALNEDNLESHITIICKNEKSSFQFNPLIKKAKKIDFIYLDLIVEETKRSILFDAIKVKLLQNESDIYFIEKGLFSNYIAKCIFDLNKIAIIY